MSVRMPISDIILYCAIFASVYVQVFFLMSFFEKKNLLSVYKPLKGDEEDLPSITFLVPCWNEETTIDNTVQSLKDLSYPKDKFFIYLIDDGSKDNTWNVMKGYENDPMVKIFKKENGGKHTALNFALPSVTTDLVASFDADTTINQDALYRIIPYFIEDKNLSAVGGSVLIKSPKTIAQKAQSIEYQMFSFTKKVLGLLGGVLVVPGAFSVFRPKPLLEVGGWQLGHNLEDLELTYRLQVKGYKVEHCHNAIAFTTGPKTVKKLFKQRLRWGYGFLNNTFDYRFAFLNKKFGNFGIFTLPMSLMSYIIIMSVFAVTWYHIILFLYDQFLVLSLVGLEGFHISAYSWFYTNTKAIVFLTLLTFIFFIVNIMIGRTISNIKRKGLINIFYFFVLYSLIVPFWVIKSVWNAINQARPAWR